MTNEIFVLLAKGAFSEIIAGMNSETFFPCSAYVVKTSFLLHEQFHKLIACIIYDFLAHLRGK